MTDTQTAASSRTAAQSGRPLVASEARRQLLAHLPATERRLQLAGISTAVLEGGAGAPIILLHGPSGYAAHWMGVIPGLVATHRVIAPDLPGHGASEIARGTLDRDRVLAWLAALIEQTCDSPPVLVGQLLGGAIAARFAAEQRHRLHRLVLVDAFGLRAFEPTPEFGLALTRFFDQPAEDTHRALWQHCAFDAEALRQRIASRWPAFEVYNIERARDPDGAAAVAALMEHLGVPAIPSAELERIEVPTALIWGRHDRATPLFVAESASARFCWPLHVIEDCADDPPVERPEALLQALYAALSAPDDRKGGRS